MSLMRSGGDYKMTSYIFAPKDDEYHKGKWRDLYPEEELAKIKEMVKVGNDSKCRFVWTAHPFMEDLIRRRQIRRFRRFCANLVVVRCRRASVRSTRRRRRKPSENDRDQHDDKSIRVGKKERRCI